VELKIGLPNEGRISGESFMATRSDGAVIIPGLRYRNAPAAIEWLCRAFGFEKNMVVPGAGNTVAHAQLTFGNGMVMLGSVTKNEFGSMIKQPDEVGGAETQSPCVLVQEQDMEPHYQRAKAAGAEIVMPLEHKEYGGSGYACKDLEGHLWYFGSYNPWEDGAAGAGSAAKADVKHVRNGFGAVRPYVHGNVDLESFVKQVFDAQVLERTEFDHGGAHLEVQIGDGVLVLEVGDRPMPSAKPGSIYVYVPDVDATYAKALKAGATSAAAPEDKSYEERGAGVKDRFGNTWWIATYRPAKK
jgi:uncharacterized glyoxalase superfamily protein PhnB